MDLAVSGPSEARVQSYSLKCPLFVGLVTLNIARVVAGERRSSGFISGPV